MVKAMTDSLIAYRPETVRQLVWVSQLGNRDMLLLTE